ncbi:mitochondrial substrate carrier family protein [Wolffia australiana]
MDELLRHHLFATHAIAAAGSITAAASLVHPLETLKSLIQVGADPRKQTNLRQVLDRVRSLYGFSGLFRGFGWSALGMNLGIGARFGTYEIITAFYKDGREDNYVQVSEALLAGLASGAVESIVANPFELFKLRHQLTCASYLGKANSGNILEETTASTLKYLPGYAADKRAWKYTLDLLSVLPKSSSSWVNSVKECPWMLTGSGRPPLAFELKSPLNIVSLEGLGGIWRGLRSGIARDCIFGGVFFCTWQFLHSAMLDWKAVDMDPPPRSMEEIGPQSPLAIAVAAGVSGSLAAIASHCFDTAKTRSQCIVTPKYISMERKFLRWETPGSWLEKKTGISPRDRGILFRGIGLRSASTGLASFVIVGGYLMAVKYIL